MDTPPIPSIREVLAERDIARPDHTATTADYLAWLHGTADALLAIANSDSPEAADARELATYARLHADDYADRNNLGAHDE